MVVPNITRVNSFTSINSEALLVDNESSTKNQLYTKKSSHKLIKELFKESKKLNSTCLEFPEHKNLKEMALNIKEISEAKIKGYQESKFTFIKGFFSKSINLIRANEFARTGEIGLKLANDILEKLDSSSPSRIEKFEVNVDENLNILNNDSSQDEELSTSSHLEAFTVDEQSSVSEHEDNQDYYDVPSQISEKTTNPFDLLEENEKTDSENEEFLDSHYSDAVSDGFTDNQSDISEDEENQIYYDVQDQFIENTPLEEVNASLDIEDPQIAHSKQLFREMINVFYTIWLDADEQKSQIVSLVRTVFMPISEIIKQWDQQDDNTFKLVLDHEVAGKHPQTTGEAVIEPIMSIRFLEEYVKKSGQYEQSIIFDRGIVHRHPIFGETSLTKISFNEKNEVTVNYKKIFNFTKKFSFEDALKFWMAVRWNNGKSLS